MVLDHCADKKYVRSSNRSRLWEVRGRLLDHVGEAKDERS